jgi:hypothetical protein
MLRHPRVHLSLVQHEEGNLNRDVKHLTVLLLHVDQVLGGSYERQRDASQLCIYWALFLSFERVIGQSNGCRRLWLSDENRCDLSTIDE